MKTSLGWSSVALLLLSASPRSAALPCASSDVSVPPVVSDTAGALQLAEALNCWGAGNFDVEWVGSVVVEETIRVFGGTSLNLTGTADKTSILDGAGTNSLFEVHSSGSLHLSRLGLINGAGIQGGAIYATDSYLTVAGCTVSNNTGDYGAGIFLEDSTLETANSLFAGNMVSVHGGAIYMSASEVTVGGNVFFEGNNASLGGAAYLTGGSVLVLAGNKASFGRNTAAVKGGGVYAEHSTVSVSGTAGFDGNSAELGGAALTYNCSLRIYGDVLFSNNSARESGGALENELSTVHVVGTAKFLNNSASTIGGGMTMWKTDMHVPGSGKAEFVGNTARNGGAVYIGRGTLDMEGEARFLENVANYSGGALYSDVSFINISGNALWEANRAPESGGGFNMWESNMTVQVSGRASFVGNLGARGGGVAIADGTIVVEGEIDFTDNLTDEEGGGLFCGNAAIIIGGAAYWDGNVAGAGGGALQMTESTLWVQPEGNAEFVGNTAGFGGAVYFYDCTMLVDGNISLSDNSALGEGGAILTDQSVVNISGIAVFEGNTSPSKGGGMFTWLSVFLIVDGGNAEFFNNSASIGGGLGLGGYTTMTISGMSTFSNNSAEVGAGIKMEQFSSASFSGAVTMVGNTATSSGGAMHCESPTLLHLDGVQFESNYAGVSGGAVTTLSAGTEVNVLGERAEPAVIWSCGFSGNKAGDAGGALFIAGGFVNIASSYFRDNVAERSGGAVLASGVTQLSQCTFERNQAGVGAAITSTVSVLLWFSNFTDNALLCDGEGLVLDWTNSSAFEAACESCTGSCSNCTVANPDSVQHCQEVLTHTTSPAATGTIETLQLQQGYWRTSNKSKEIRECYETDACKGGAKGYCSEGYQGPLCAVCAKGYTTGLGYSCLKCSSQRRKATVTIAAIFLVVAIAVAVLSVIVLGKRSARESAAASRFFSGSGVAGFRSGLKRAKTSQVPKILVVSWQIVTQFSMVASVAYPDMYEVFLKHINVVNLNFGWILSAGCLIETGFYHNLLLSTLTPLVVVCGVALSNTVIASRWRSADSREARARSARRHASALFWVSFLVYATVSSTIFQTFACDDFDDDNSYLRADLSLQCYTATHTWFMAYAGVMAVIYPFGIPVCYACVLYRGREAVKRRAVAGETCTTDVAVLRELWIAYRPEAYFYEVVECVRRAVLSGVIVFIFPNTAGQVATAFLLALFFAAVFMVLDPYTSRWDTWAARTGHIVVLMSMFVALLQKVDIDEDDNFSQNVFAGVLVLANVVMILAAGAEMGGMFLTAVWEARQSVAVQSSVVAARSTRSVSLELSRRSTSLNDN